MTALLIEPLEARQMLAAQLLTGPGAAAIGSANSSKASGTVQSIVNPWTPTAVTILSGAIGYAGSSDSKSKSQPTDGYSTGLVQTTEASVWQSGSYAVGPLLLTLDGLTSPNTAPDPIRFLSLGDSTPLSDHSNSPFAQATVLEWQPGQLAGDSSSADDAGVMKSVVPGDARITLLRPASSARESVQPSPTIFGEQWGSSSGCFNRWVLRDGQSSDRPTPQANPSRQNCGRQASQTSPTRTAAPTAAPASMSQKAFDALAYFAQVGAAIDTAARANTALTAQRIQQILFACRRVTVDVIQMSLRTLLSASTKAAAVLLVGTVLASRAARPKNKRKGREPLSDQELMAASGVAMSSAWLCFRSGSPRG